MSLGKLAFTRTFGRRNNVQLEDAICELWRGGEAIERIPADQIDKVEPPPA